MSSPTYLLCCNIFRHEVSKCNVERHIKAQLDIGILIEVKNIARKRTWNDKNSRFTFADVRGSSHK